MSSKLAPIRTCSIPTLALFHMRHPTRLSFSKEIVAMDGGTCAIDKGLAPTNIFFGSTYYGIPRV